MEKVLSIIPVHAIPNGSEPQLAPLVLDHGGNIIGTQALVHIQELNIVNGPFILVWRQGGYRRRLKGRHNFDLYFDGIGQRDAVFAGSDDDEVFGYGYHLGRSGNAYIGVGRYYFGYSRRYGFGFRHRIRVDPFSPGRYGDAGGPYGLRHRPLRPGQ